MMAHNKPARRQHFIARFYLRNFAEPMFSDKLLVYTREAKLWEQRTPRGIGWFLNLFTINNAGKRTDEFDRFLKRHVEDPAAPALKKMAEGQAIETECERSAIALFISLTALRSPSMVDTNRNGWLREIHGREREETECILEAYAKECEQPVSYNVFFKRAQFGAIWAKVNNLKERLMHWNWNILTTTLDRPFVTSDWPAYWSKDQHSELVTFPVSSTAALLASSGGPYNAQTQQR